MKKANKACWYSDINLYGGKLEYIMDDDEDMLTITYKKGLIIDVGYISELNTYFITAVKDASVKSWNSPMMSVEVHDKNMLANALQNVIIQLHNHTK